MALTRVAVERVLIRRCGSFLDAAGLSTEAYGTNDDLSDPLAWALRQLGYTPTDFETASNTDLAAVASGHYDALLDLAELRTLESVQNNYTSTDSKVGQVWEAAGQLLEQLRTIIPLKRKAVQAAHGSLLVAPLTDEAARIVRLYAV